MTETHIGSHTEEYSVVGFRDMLLVELHTGLPPAWFNGRKQALLERSHLVYVRSQQ